MTTYSIAIAGTTERTVICAEALRQDERFEIAWVLTPEPKPVDRDQRIEPNPVHAWANENQIETILVKKRLDAAIQETITAKPRHDFILVVDFGYLVPTWLLEWPNVYPLNIHPSALPKWRGSSPGQFVLLSGETESAVTLMVMNEGLDTGPILAQLPFEVNPTWTQTEYYQHAFELLRSQLADLVNDVAAKKILPQPQPSESPTPIAARLKKDDSFVEWSVIASLMAGEVPQELGNTAELLKSLVTKNSSWPQVLERAQRAFQPWPNLWTLLPTKKGPKRMKILSCRVNNQQLVLETVQIEGQQAAKWNQVKNVVSAEN